jgi:hypothetical protein
MRVEGRGERWQGRGLEHDEVTSDIGEIKKATILSNGSREDASGSDGGK